jgi:hypothetical protein
MASSRVASLVLGDPCGMFLEYDWNLAYTGNTVAS